MNPLGSSPISRDRRRLSAMLAGAATLGATSAFLKHAHAAEFTLKFASSGPVNYSLNVRVREAAERIRKETNGAVNILSFPNNQLGGDSDMFGQVRSGAIQMYAMPGQLAQNVVTDCGIQSLAFAFKSYKEVWAAIDGDLGDHIKNSMRPIGIYTFSTVFDNGFRQITSRERPILTPADLVGFKIRTPTSPMITSIFEGLGAVPTAINLKETYAALQTRIADGQENALYILDQLKLYEVQKHCSITNHVWDGFWMAVNSKYWESLPSDVRKVIEKNIDRAATLQRADIEILDAGMQTELRKRGITFHVPEQMQFREALKKSGYFTNWRRSFSPQAWSLLQKYVGVLG